MYSGIKSKFQRNKYDEADKEFKNAEKILCKKTYMDLKNFYLKKTVDSFLDKDLYVEAKNILNEIQHGDYPVKKTYYDKLQNFIIKKLQKKFSPQQQNKFILKIENYLKQYNIEDFYKVKKFLEESKKSLMIEEYEKNMKKIVKKHAEVILNSEKYQDIAYYKLDELTDYLSESKYLELVKKRDCLLSEKNVEEDIRQKIYSSNQTNQYKTRVFESFEGYKPPCWDRYINNNNNDFETLITKVAGLTFENRQTICQQLVKGDKVKLHCEPENVYDHNAVAVYFKKQKIGYIPRQSAPKIGKLIREKSHLVSKVVEVSGGGEYNYGVTIKIQKIDMNKSSL